MGEKVAMCIAMGEKVVNGVRLDSNAMGEKATVNLLWF